MKQIVNTERKLNIAYRFKSFFDFVYLTKFSSFKLKSLLSLLIYSCPFTVIRDSLGFRIP